MAKKYYAVKKGLKTGIFTTWPECKASVTGFPGAEFKGFSTKAEAEAYLEGVECTAVDAQENAHSKVDGNNVSENSAKEEIERVRAGVPDDTVVVYVDGSFDLSLEKYSFGCIILTPDGSAYRECGNGDDPQALSIRNVAGEMLGAMYAAKWVYKHGYRKLELRYDYAGIEMWATGAWKANNELTQKYAKYMMEHKGFVDITFTKVKAHSGDFFNEEVDQLAKEALVKANGIPKVTG